MLTIQKSWKNFKIMMFLNASRFDFYLTYKLNVSIKICFYINQNINFQKWKMKHFSLNMNTFKLKFWLKLMIKMIYIHHVYNSLLTSYVFIDNSFMLSMIKHQLQTDAKHVLMKNFNLHHSMWCGSSRFTQHAVMNQLLNLIETADLNLILSQNMITWQKKNAMSIIDLMFMLKYLREKLIHCKIKSK